LVLIITAYNTVFNTTGTPDGFSFILAIDWFMDRLRTTMNVSGDTVVAGIVAHLCPLEEMVGEAGAGAGSFDKVRDDNPPAGFDESNESIA
jgi:Na+/H+-dicarboxylate symporter